MAQIQKKFIAPNAVDQSKVRLDNNSTLRGRNAADSADIDILKVNSSDRIEFASVPQVTSDAVAGNDVVRLSQISSLLDGLKPKTAVVVASTANIDLASTSDPGAIDGHTLADGDRILLWQQTSAAENGIYVATTAINPSTWVRSSDFNATSEIPGAYTVAEFGTVSQGTLFVCTSSPTTLGTDAINFAKRTITVNTYTGGDMISIDGSNVVSVDLATNGGLESTNPGNAAGQLQVKVDSAGALALGAGGVKAQVEGSTIKINGSNQLEGLKELEEKITLLAGDITNQYVDLAHAAFGVDAANNSLSLFVVGGPMQEKAVDYTVSLAGGAGGVTRVTFAGDLATGGGAALIAGDKLVIKYNYLT